MAKKHKAKATCLGCGHLMGAKARFCQNCQEPNPNVTVKAAAAAVTKSASIPYASPLSLQAVREQQAWAAVKAERDPNLQRAVYMANFGHLLGGEAA
jgi:hypothetical protein